MDVEEEAENRHPGAHGPPTHVEAVYHLARTTSHEHFKCEGAAGAQLQRGPAA